MHVQECAKYVLEYLYLLIVTVSSVVVKSSVDDSSLADGSVGASSLASRPTVVMMSWSPLYEKNIITHMNP